MAITVLGKTFETEEERREYFRDELREKLPELKKMEGFPIGEDEDIIELSDPPYYTACPNPWQNEILEDWEKEKKLDGEKNGTKEVTVPLARDVTEGKSNKIYNAHSYHTKIPHPAIMRYILHYTEPGDIVFDGFAGTGMTGVAANQCGTPTKKQRSQIDSEWKENYGRKPNWGHRNAVLTDLSPLCSFISSNLNSKFSIEDFLKYSDEVINRAWEKNGWMYKTNHQNLGKGEIIYSVWSAIYECPECQYDMLYWEASMNEDRSKQSQNLTCPSCGAVTKKRNCDPKIETYFDNVLSESKERVKEVPVMISYKYGGSRYEKEPDKHDLKILKDISNREINSFIPDDKIMGKGSDWGDTYRAGYHTGITNYHHLYTKRNLLTIATINDEINNLGVNERIKKALKFWFSSSQNRLDKTNRYSYNHSRHVGPLSNTLYISATPAEISPFYFFKSKQKHFKKLRIPEGKNVTQVGDSADLSNINNETVDYLFIDPPYGDNIPYAELNSVLEFWLKVKTEIKKETIVSKKQGKGLYEYQELLSKSFREFFRVLKPGKWMTVVFSNTEAAVWNVIQNSINQAGFVISNVSAIDTSRPGLHGIIGPVAVRQPLVISCYKPTETFRKTFESDSESTLWEFVEEYLSHLPIHVVKENKSTAIIERSPKILYDRLVAYYVQKNRPVPIDAGKFQKELRDRYVERDGMFFTNEQVQEYDRKKKEVPGFTQLSILVASEQDGVLWLQNFLKDSPKTYQDIYNDWVQALGGERKGDIIPELKTILEENFLKNDDGEWYVPDPDKEEDLEKLRNRRLLKQFEDYKEKAFKPKGKIKECRVEALRAGFKQSYQDKDFETIVRVGDRIPENLLMEDEVLLQFYDIAAGKV